MEIADFAFPPMDYRAPGPKPKAIFKAPEIFLSNAEAFKLLEESRVSIIEVREEPDSSALKITLLAIMVFSMFGGLVAWIAASNTAAKIDHSLDVVTPYRCRADKFESNRCRRLTESGLLTNESLWIDHTRDLWIPDLTAGLLSMGLISFLPPLAAYTAWKTWRHSIRQKLLAKNQELLQRNNEITDAQCALACSSPDSESPTDPIHISRLVALNVLSKVAFGKLGFMQIKQLKRDYPDLFAEQLKAQNFAEMQCLYWNKMHIMLRAEPEKLIAAIENRNNAEIFAQAPLFLESLIQELDPKKLSDGVKGALAAKMQELDENSSDTLSRASLSQSIDFISRYKISLEEAIDKLAISSSQIDLEVTLHFDNEKSTSTSRTLLTTASPVFQAMINTAFKEGHSREILLREVDQTAFEVVINYLRTNELQLDEIDLAPMLKIADEFEFSALKTALEKHLCQNLDALIKDHPMGTLLRLCEDYDLQNLKKAFDLKLSYTCSQIKYKAAASAHMQYLGLATEFQLPATLETLSGLFRQVLQDESTSEETWVRLLLDIAEIDKESFLHLFAACTSTFQRRPSLLKELWKAAADSHCKIVKTAIISFCHVRANAHIYLAIWGIPPGEDFPKKTLRIE